MLSLNHATIGFGGRHLFEDASLHLRRGEIKGFIAPNGYGKTTLMRTLAGDFSHLIRGTVSVEQTIYSKDFNHQDVLYIPGDSSSLYAHLNAAEHLRIAKSLWNSERSIDDVAEQWDIEPFLRKPIRSLSQGMKQQVCLAIASMCSCRYLLFDEPTNALDPINASRALSAMEGMAQNGAGILVSSHIFGTIDTLCHSLVLIEDRRLCETAGRKEAQAAFSDSYLPKHVRL